MCPTPRRTFMQVISKAGSMFTIGVAGTAAIDVNDIDVTSCLLIAMPNVDDAPFSTALRPSTTKIGDFTTAGEHYGICAGRIGAYCTGRDVVQCIQWHNTRALICIVVICPAAASHRHAN